MLYTPHTVSIINYQNYILYLTVLRGVMLQGPEGMRHYEVFSKVAFLYYQYS